MRTSDHHSPRGPTQNLSTLSAHQHTMQTQQKSHLIERTGNFLSTGSSVQNSIWPMQSNINYTKQKGLYQQGWQINRLLMTWHIQADSFNVLTVLTWLTLENCASLFNGWSPFSQHSWMSSWNSVNGFRLKSLEMAHQYFKGVASCIWDTFKFKRMQ